MGFYRYSCSPYDVQQRNGKRFDFATLAKHYEDTKPLRGKRKDENIRPIGQRDRYWERMIKVSDTEYYITYDYYRYRTSHNRGITFRLNDGMEYMTVHTPKAVWRSPDELHPRTLSSSSIFWFFDFNMPVDFGMVNYQSNKYIRYNNLYYTIEKGDVVFQRKVGTTEWQPLVVHREFKHTLDRKQAKELRKVIEPFFAYYDIMCEMVDSKYNYGNAIVRAIHDDELQPTTPEQALALFKPQDDGVPDEWLKMVEHYKQKIQRYAWDYTNRQHTTVYARDNLPKKVEQDLFAIVRPCKETEVPLGKLNNDRYKGWYQ